MANLQFIPKEQFTALALQVAALEGLIHAAVANVAALKALSTTNFKDGTLVPVESTGVLYRFNLGEAVGSEDPPNTYDATDAGGVYHITVAKDMGIHLPVADIAGLKAIIAAARGEGMLCLVKNNGAAMADLYRYDATSVAAEALPGIVSPTDIAGRWIAVGVADLKGYYDTLYSATGHTHATLPTTSEKAAIASYLQPVKFFVLGGEPAPGLPVGTRVIAYNSANGFTINRIYTLTADTPADVWAETTPAQGDHVMALEAISGRPVGEYYFANDGSIGWFQVPRQSVTPTQAANGAVNGILGTPAADKAQADTGLKYIASAGSPRHAVVECWEYDIQASAIPVFVDFTGPSYACRLLSVEFWPNVANVGETITVQDAAGGGGASILLGAETIPAAVVGERGWNDGFATQPYDLTASKAMSVLKSLPAVAGALRLYVLPLA